MTHTPNSYPRWSLRPRLLTSIIGLVAALSLAAGCAGSPTANSEGETAPETRIIKTDEGDVEIPAKVEKIVTTHNIATQPLIDLGVTPVGIGPMNPEASYPDYWQKIKDIKQIASGGGATNVEMVAELAPDLIFATNMTDDQEIAQLEQIAPVIQIGIDGPKRSQWQQRAELVAEVVQKEDAAAELRLQYEERAAEIKSTHGDVLADQTVNVLDSFDKSVISPYSSTSMVGNILTLAGGRFAASGESERVKASDGSSAGSSNEKPFSYEELADLTDGTVILHGSQVTEGNAPTPTQQAMLDSSLLKASKAGKAGHVYPIGKTTIAGYGDAFGTLELFESALEQL